MSRWLDMARAAEKPSVPFANIAINAKNPEIRGQSEAKVTSCPSLGGGDD